ncbi:MAG: bacterial Ig-like domain-containing protein [Clostridia bacterium]|nr:bacterial Ig-like domain-containing protein [Clostridia bacterium]
MKKRNNFRLIKYVALVAALVALVALCLTSCGKALPTQVEVIADPAKTEYNLNDVFDCTGAKIKVTYDNGSTEEFDVTLGMITPTEFTSTSIKHVTVTYAENGVSVTTVINVTVIDQFASERAQAIAGMNPVAEANKTDLGIAALISEYTKDIKAATSAETIAALAAQFAADSSAYLAEKADLLDDLAGLIAKVEDERDLTLYDQYLTAANNEVTKANTAIKAAATISAAEKALADCEYALHTLLDTQQVYEKEDGLNDQKLALLKEIVTYKERGNLLITYVEEVLNDPATSDSVKGVLRAQIQTYNTAIDTLNDAYNAVILALDLSKIQALIDEALEDLRTPIDDIYDTLKGGIEEIVPAPFFADKQNGAWALNTDADTVGALLKSVQDNYDKAVALFGTTRTNEMMEAYKYIDADGKTAYADLMADWTTIDTTYNTLVDWQDDSITDVIGKLDAAIASKADADIAAAWVALQTWGNGKVFTFNDTTTVMASKLGFDLECVNGTYAFPETFGKYALTLDHMITYFVPNYNEFLEAVAENEALELKQTVQAIGQVIYSADLTLDSNQAITDARQAIADYIANYGQDNYDQYCCENDEDVLLKTVEEKATEWTNRKALADSIIANVKASVAAKNIAAIEIKDYTDDNSVLAKAYADYVAFLAANTLTEDRGTQVAGYVVKDVLQVSADYTAGEVDAVDAVDAQLIARVKEYIKKYIIVTIVDDIALELNPAFATKLGQYTKNEQSAEYNAVKEYYIAQVAIMNAYVVDFSGVNADATNLVKVGDATTSVLDVNVVAVDALAAKLAGEIANYVPVV